MRGYPTTISEWTNIEENLKIVDKKMLQLVETAFDDFNLNQVRNLSFSEPDELKKSHSQGLQELYNKYIEMTKLDEKFFQYILELSVWIKNATPEEYKAFLAKLSQKNAVLNMYTHIGTAHSLHASFLNFTVLQARSRKNETCKEDEPPHLQQPSMP